MTNRPIPHPRRNSQRAQNRSQYGREIRRRRPLFRRNPAATACYDRSAGYNRYSCNYGFQQEWNNPIGFEKYGPDYIIAGTNNYGPFRVNHITEPSMQKDSYQAIEQYTNTGIPHNQLFQNFPAGTNVKDRNPIVDWESEYD